MKQQKYTIKPVDVSAIRWTGVNLNEVEEFTSECDIRIYMQSGDLYLKTSNKDMKVNEDDYIIKNEDVCYPVSPDTFNKNFKSVDGELFDTIGEAIRALTKFANNPDNLEGRGKARQIAKWLGEFLNIQMINPIYLTSMEGWKKVVSKYGYKQIPLLIEEMSELTQALIKYLRYAQKGQPIRKNLSDVMEDITEEFTDVLIMLMQIRYLLSINGEIINEIACEKLNRTLELMEDRMQEEQFEKLAESNTRKILTDFKKYLKPKVRTCDECRFLRVLNDDTTGVYAECPAKTFCLWEKEDIYDTTCACWEEKC